MDLSPAWSTISSSPWVLALFALGSGVVVSRTYLRLRWMHLAIRGRDVQRRFTGATRSAVLRRAGNRCEHHYFYFLRCPETTQLEVDHIHPHSRGGSTTLGNGQVLCKRHNRLKGARIPFTWELNRLATVRRRYFPPSVETAVVRRQPRSGVKPASPPHPHEASFSEAPIASMCPLTAEELLGMWSATYGIDLSMQHRAAFLSHPAITDICRSTREEIAAELPHHQRLDDLSAALSTHCHA